MNLRLDKPSLKYKESFLQGLDDCENERSAQSWIYLHESEVDIAKEDFKSYVEKLLSYEHTPHEHFVRGVTFWAIVNDEVVGRLGLRLELNEGLEKFGGHIGYIVRPKFRKRGIATKMLSQSLQTQYSRDLKRILLTCDIDNIASEKTIVKNGGEFYDIVELEGRKNKKRFWIKL